MRAPKLHDLWTSPDNTRLTSKQYSFRLPTHIAAKIEALWRMYPNKNRTQVAVDLLIAALDQPEQNLPEAPGERVDSYIQARIEEDERENAEQYYFMGGRRGEFRSPADPFYREIE
jgi:hypothetical protein